MYRSEINYYKKAFLLAVVMGVILFLPFVCIDGGYFIYYGDYNAQQIPFYQNCNETIKSGSFMWDWHTDMGTNFIGSYSFYTLGSPFFWLTMPFPATWSKYFMAPLLVLKFACCSMFAFAYIRRFVKKPQSALIGGLLYAFSSFSLYNVFFNHFHEAMVFFPVMLIALEETVINKRRVFFALTVAINAFVNYFFFIGECVFLVVYFLCRLTDKKFRIDKKTFFVLAFESVAGVALSGVMFIPAILSCLDTPRSINPMLGWNMVFHNPSQRYGIIFQSLFFPCDIPARQNFFPDSSAKWSSVAAYLPLFSMSGVFSFMKYKKKHWAKLLMPIMLLFALIPVLNSTFVMFNNSYYTRWFYMPILVACMMTSVALESKDIDMRYGLKWCAVGVGIISMVGILPSQVKKTITDPVTSSSVTTSVTEFFALPNNRLPFWMSIAFAVIAILVCFLLVHNKNKQKTAKFLKKATVFTVVACLGFSYYTIIYGRVIGPKVGDYNSIVDAKFDLEDDGETFYRVESYGVSNNANVFWDEYGFRSFHSILPGSSFSYYKGMGFNRSVNTDPDGKYYAMRSLNSVKYFIVQTYKKDYRDTIETLEQMSSFEYYGEQNGFTIYKNNAFIPMGYSYNYYVDDLAFNSVSDNVKGNLLVRAVFLSDEQIEKYSDILLDGSDDKTVNAGDKAFSKTFTDDCKELSKACVDSFEAVANGFIAKSSFTADRFVVFTVPYESGWSATINVEPAEIEVVNNGVMGIRVPSGECEIVFSYVTPGLKYGLILTAATAVILLLYYIMLKKVFKYAPDANRHLNDLERRDGIRIHNYYINNTVDSADLALSVEERKDEDNASVREDDIE